MAYGLKACSCHPLRVYWNPDQFCDCLYIFLKTYNTLVTSCHQCVVSFEKNMTDKCKFLIGYIPSEKLLHLNFTNSSGYWFMAQNMKNIDFRTFFLL